MRRLVLLIGQRRTISLRSTAVVLFLGDVRRQSNAQCAMDRLRAGSGELRTNARLFARPHRKLGSASGDCSSKLSPAAGDNVPNTAATAQKQSHQKRPIDDTIRTIVRRQRPAPEADRLSTDRRSRALPSSKTTFIAGASSNSQWRESAQLL